MNPDRKLVSDIQQLILDKEETLIGERLSEALADPPRLHWDPGNDVIGNEQLLNLHTFWTQLESFSGSMPKADDVDLLDLESEAPYTMLLDVEDDGWDFWYRYYGAGIAERSGFDLTGRGIWEIPTASQIGIFFAACYRAVLERKRPLLTWHMAPSNIAVVSWDRLIMPLANASGTDITRLLVGNIPGAWRRVRD